MDTQRIKEHYERWQANCRSVEELEQSLPENPWRLVIQFYAALHLVDAYLKSKASSFHPRKHEQRWKAIHASPELQKNHSFRTAYQRLQDVSEQVRYEPGFVVSSTHYQQLLSDRKTVELHLLAKVERLVQATLC